MKSRILVIALALVFVFSAVAAIAGPKAQGPKAGKEKPGDVLQYEFGTAYMDSDSIELCWDEVDSLLQPAGLTEEAVKFSVCVFGPLYITYLNNTVEVEAMIDEWEYCWSYIPAEGEEPSFCDSASLGSIRGAIEDMIEYAYGTVVTYDFATVSAKVKGLDPSLTPGKKRQDNVWSPIYTFGTPIGPLAPAP